MKRWLIGSVAALFATAAFGAKAHRTAKKELTPKFKETAAEVKAACGVAPKISVDWKAFNKVPTDKIKDYKSNIGYELKYIGEQSKKFCSDDESKALYKKNVKSIVISVVEKGDPVTEFRKGTFTIKTTKQMNSGGYKFLSTMEEW